MGRQGRKHKQLLDDFKERKGYWKLKEEALDVTLCRTRFWKRVLTRRKTDYGMTELSVKCSSVSLCCVQ
jgi:hypothetical protein